MGEVTKTVRTQIVPNQAIIMDNAYSYDAVSNVLGIQNNAPLPQSGKAGGQMSHSYTYDPLYRLSSATGTYKGTDNKTASYTLAMGYDNCTASRARSTSRKVTCSSTVPSMQAMTSPTHTIMMRARSSNWPVSVTSITARKKPRRTARTSTTDTSTPMMPTETLFTSTPAV